MRLFAAIEVPADITDEVAAWWQGACLYLPATEWRDVPRLNWHLTLAFYGDVQGGKMDFLQEALAECTENTAPVQLCLGQAGVFPDPGRARVFWLGIEDAGRQGRLKTLAQCCRRAVHATVRKHSAREERFRGHLTLARRRGFPAPVSAEALAGIPRPPQAQWTAESVTLFQSQLYRDGARYRVLEEFGLTG